MPDRVLNGLRLALGLLTATALGFQLYRLGAQGGSVANFFSYFTILGNVLGMGVFLVGGLQGLRGRGRVPDLLRGAAALYLAVTGLVYLVALQGLGLGLTLPWVDDVLHRVMPVVVLADWLIDPPRRRIEYHRALRWLLFPLLYLPYTLIRGHVTDWYPYPFLDPGRHGGYARVAVASAMITVAFLGIGALIVVIGNRLGARAQSGRTS
ncbi:Pr6Pr family membrane protein [Kitasatospora sp. NPDC051853]|uniref:Pr6Pr family membrane protein n=1 Tax=Kitasatospora sp. NPDC051853 TaxID=3364058 RepID=UPI0037BA39DA